MNNLHLKLYLHSFLDMNCFTTYKSLKKKIKLQHLNLQEANMLFNKVYLYK